MTDSHYFFRSVRRSKGLLEAIYNGRRKKKDKKTNNDQDLHVVNSHKHLSVIISDNGQWNDHIDNIVKKSYNRLNIMRKSRTFLDRYSLEKKLYFFYKIFNGVR